MALARIQRSRAAGWRMPEGARYVGRPTAFGNPWRLVPADADAGGPIVDLTYDVGLPPYVAAPPDRYYEADGRWWSIARYFSHLRRNPELVARARAELTSDAGVTALACWCPLEVKCHADALISVLTCRDEYGNPWCLDHGYGPLRMGVIGARCDCAVA